MRADPAKAGGLRQQEFHLTEDELAVLSRDTRNRLPQRADGSWSYRLKTHTN